MARIQDSAMSGNTVISMSLLLGCVSLKCNFVRHNQKHGVESRSASGCQAQSGFQCAKPAVILHFSLQPSTDKTLQSQLAHAQHGAKRFWFCNQSVSSSFRDRAQMQNLCRDIFKVVGPTSRVFHSSSRSRAKFPWSLRGWTQDWLWICFLE